MRKLISFHLLSFPFSAFFTGLWLKWSEKVLGSQSYCLLLPFTHLNPQLSLHSSLPSIVQRGRKLLLLSLYGVKVHWRKWAGILCYLFVDLLLQGPYKRNGLNQVSTSDPKKGGAAGGGVVRTGSGGGESSKKLKPAASRFTICKAHKASRRKKEKSSAKRERKATKTLAIVLGKEK